MPNDKREADRDFADRLTAAANASEILPAVISRLDAIDRRLSEILEKSGSGFNATSGPPTLLYTLEAAARTLSLHRATVRALVTQGYLPARKVGRLFRIHRKDLEAVAKIDIPSVWGNEKPWPAQRQRGERKR